MPLECLPQSAQEIILQCLDLGCLLRKRATGRNRFWKRQFDHELERRARDFLMANNPQQQLIAPHHCSEHGELNFSVEITNNALPAHHLNRQNVVRHATASFSRFLFADAIPIPHAIISRDLERCGSVSSDWFAAEVVHQNRTNLEALRLVVESYYGNWVHKWISPPDEHELNSDNDYVVSRAKEQQEELEAFRNMKDTIACVLLFAADSFRLSAWKLKLVDESMEETAIIIRDAERAQHVIVLKAFFCGEFY